MAKRPLEGIRVLELTTGAAGPTVGKILCEFGADVIRSETRLRGDGHRGDNPEKWNQRPDFVKLQRGKKSFTVNLQTERGRELVQQLARTADVLVENYGLGVLEKWGLAWERLHAINPDCILIRVKGLGCTGPHAKDLTYGPNVGNIVGTTHVWNYAGADTPTAEPRSQHPDFMGGITGAYAVVLALIHRRKTGQAQWIDNAQYEVGASILGPWYLDYSVIGREPEPQGNRSPSAAPYGAYPCKGDERWCVIAIYTQDEWERFATLVEASGIERNENFSTHLGRMHNREALDHWVGSWTQDKDPYEVMRTLQNAGIGAAVVQDVGDQFENDPQYAARGFLVRQEEPELGEVATEQLPPRLSETPGGVHGSAPLMGEHTHEICRELLGLSDEEIAHLEEEKVLY